MISIEELKQRFPVMDVKPYGPCLIVPGTEFNPDWEGQLDEQGYRCFEVDIAGKAATLVCLKLNKGTGGEVYTANKTKDPVIEPEKLKEKHPRKRRKDCWDPEDEKRLLKRWDEVKGTTKERAKQLTPEFPGRKPQGLYQKHWALTTSSTGKQQQKPMIRLKETKQNTPEYAPRSTPSTLLNEVVEIVKTLKDLRDSVAPQSFFFKHHCRNCGDIGDAEDSKVWKFCPKCGDPLIVWNIEPRENAET